MTGAGGTPKAVPRARPRRARFALRDGAVVEGGLFMNDGQALAPYLGTRKGGWVNAVNATWLAEDETHNHAVLQSEHILFAWSPEREIPMHLATSNTRPREVDIGLEDGTRVQGVLNLSERQRLCDYLHSSGRFVAVLDATRLPAGDALGDVALNSSCIKVVRDRKLATPDVLELEADETSDTAGPARAVAGTRPPVNRDVVQRPTGAYEVITEGRAPDRRTASLYTPAPSSFMLAVAEPAAASLSPEQRALADTIARHWLVQLGAAGKLSPPDPRELPASPTLEDLWLGLSRRNDMAEGELALHVATAFKLPVANLDDITPEALQAVPERLARKLGVIPLKTDGRSLEIAVSDPNSMEIEQQLGFVTRLALRFSVAPPADIRGALDWHFGASTDGPGTPRRPSTSQQRK